MTTKFNFRMLTIAREARGLTQTQLSENIPNLTQSYLSKIEKGILNATEESIRQIANILGFPESFFYDDYNFTPFSNIYYRKLISAPVKKMTQLEAALKLSMMAIDGLLDSIEIPEFEIPEINIAEIGDPEKVAREVRYKLNICDGNIPDIVKTLEQNGVVVIEIDCDIDKFSGMSVQTQKRNRIIFINSKMPNDRKRFTIGHELGHIVMHIPFSSETLDRDIEKDADLFASEFLMPFKDFRNTFPSYTTYRHLDLIKKYWGTSKQSILFKAKHHKLIDQNKYKSFMVQLSMNGERKIERTLVDFPEPSLLQKIFNAYYNDLDYSEEELVSAINIPYTTLPWTMNQGAKIISLIPKHKIVL